MTLVDVTQEVSTTQCKSSLTKVSPTGQKQPPRAHPAMGVRSWRERGCRPRDGAPQCVTWWEADGVQALAGSSPRRAVASGGDPTGVEERGMPAEGELGNLGEPSVSLSHARNGGPGDQKPWRDLGASTR